MFSRCIDLIGESNFNKIQNTNVLIIGIGGVGGYALESLVRSGVNYITVVDYDVVDESNLNRQIISDINNIGLKKTDVALKRAKSINPNININAINKKVTEDNIDEIINNNYDYIIDACDTTIVKFLLMKKRDVYKYKLISSMGTAKKINPTKLSITTLDKTSYDPLAKKLRYMLRKDGIKGKFVVVSSTEEIIETENLGSLIFVPAYAGILLANYVITDLINS